MSAAAEISTEILPSPAPPGQTEFLVSMLNGSQAKTAYALRLNIEKLVCGNGRGELADDPTTGRKFWRCLEPEFLNSTGFLTLTAGDYFCNFHGKKIPDEKNFCPLCGNRMHFEKIHDSDEANRRFNNLNRRVIQTIFSRAVAVTERHKDKAIHFHLIGRLASGADIRTGLNFEALKNRDYRSASPALRALWAMLRDTLPVYGFGRHELLPIRKTAEAVAAYVSKYIEKNICNRLSDDKRKKLVRYIGWHKAQIKPNEFSWATERARAWRAKTRECAALIFCESREDCAEVMGPRWAFHISGVWQKIDDRPVPFIQWDFPTRECARRELMLHCEKHVKKSASRMREFSEILREMKIDDGDFVLPPDPPCKFEVERARLRLMALPKRELRHLGQSRRCVALN
ncbi:MAG TPA: hypothetical protein VK742_08290 [Candidatus Sulfotelmatobacter sp.]|jgi:hypothetical protein|nr:hypothetical protein [Candidatus Sulfotelmatobacter sp.]